MMEKIAVDEYEDLIRTVNEKLEYVRDADQASALRATFIERLEKLKEKRKILADLQEQFESNQKNILVANATLKDLQLQMEKQKKFEAEVDARIAALDAQGKNQKTKFRNDVEEWRRKLKEIDDKTSDQTLSEQIMLNREALLKVKEGVQLYKDQLKIVKEEINENRPIDISNLMVVKKELESKSEQFAADSKRYELLKFEIENYEKMVNGLKEKLIQKQATLS